MVDSIHRNSGEEISPIVSSAESGKEGELGGRRILKSNWLTGFASLWHRLFSRESKIQPPLYHYVQENAISINSTALSARSIEVLRQEWPSLPRALVHLSLDGLIKHPLLEGTAQSLEGEFSLPSQSLEFGAVAFKAIDRFMRGKSLPFKEMTFKELQNTIELAYDMHFKAEDLNSLEEIIFPFWSNKIKENNLAEALKFAASHRLEAYFHLALAHYPHSAKGLLTPFVLDPKTWRIFYREVKNSKRFNTDLEVDCLKAIGPHTTIALFEGATKRQIGLLKASKAPDIDLTCAVEWQKSIDERKQALHQYIQELLPQLRVLTLGSTPPTNLTEILQSSPCRLSTLRIMPNENPEDVYSVQFESDEAGYTVTTNASLKKVWSFLTESIEKNHPYEYVHGPWKEEILRTSL